MKFKVTIDFRRGPSFEAVVDANSKFDAEVRAALLARGNGFHAIPKKVTARPV